MDARNDDILDLDDMERGLLLALAQVRQVTSRRRARLVIKEPAPALPVDKTASTPYVHPHKDFVLVGNSPYISSELAKELAEAARELREWLSRPNGSLSEPMNAMITCSLQEKLNRAVRRVEVAIIAAEKAADDSACEEEE
jgi:hypothetical protein